MTAVYGDEVTRPEAVGIVHCGYTTRIHLHLSLLYYFTEANDIYTLIWGDQSMIYLSLINGNEFIAVYSHHLPSMQSP